MKYMTVVFLLAATAECVAQPASDPIFLQKAIDAIAAQRNNALNGEAIAQATISMLNEKIAKLEKEIADAKQKSSTSQNNGGGSPQP